MSVDMDKNSSATTSVMSAVYAVPRVNLLPSEILSERKLRRTQATLGAVVLAVVGAVAGGFVLAAASAATAQDDLAVEQARTQSLLTEQGEYSEVPQVLGQLDATRTAQADAMETDVLWYDYLDRLAASYPKNVWLRDMNITVSPVVAATDPSAAGALPVSDAIGTISFNGTGLVHDDVAAWLDALDTIEGFQNATYSTSARTELDGRVVVDFTSTVEVGREALSLRFEPEAS
jgi:Tfp pilus assembly protein PilN